MVGNSQLTVLRFVYALPIPIAITRPVVWIVRLKSRRDPIWAASGVITSTGLCVSPRHCSDRAFPSNARKGRSHTTYALLFTASRYRVPATVLCSRSESCQS